MFGNGGVVSHFPVLEYIGSVDISVNHYRATSSHETNEFLDKVCLDVMGKELIGCCMCILICFAAEESHADGVSILY